MIKNMSTIPVLINVEISPLYSTNGNTGKISGAFIIKTYGNED